MLFITRMSCLPSAPEVILFYVVVFIHWHNKTRPAKSDSEECKNRSYNLTTTNAK